MIFTKLAIFLAVFSGIVPLIFGNNGNSAKLSRIFNTSLLGLSGVFATLAGGVVLFNHLPQSFQLSAGLPWLAWQFKIDVLSGFFFAIVGIITITISMYAPSYLSHIEKEGRNIKSLLFFSGFFIASMLMVLLADNVFTFMFAWEMMSLSSYFLVIFEHDKSSSRSAGFIYLVMAHLSGLILLLGFGILMKFTSADSSSFDAMHHLPLSMFWATLVFASALLGFGMKAGIIPLHAWLPRAHPVAPSHISALMSGVMLKIAIYGFIRFCFDFLGILYWQWGVIVLLLGIISTFGGVLYALMQTDFKRLLAYSSIENIGIIFIGLGLSMIFCSIGHPLLGALGLVAALYHCLSHALFKSLLFLGAGAILQQTHEHDLENMGGLIHKMPQTSLYFLIGCLSISALPPLNGFVSEWLIFQNALQAPLLQEGLLKIVIPISAAVLALASALAAACFIKVYGIAFLGKARSQSSELARETNFGMRASMGLLAILCLLFGVFPIYAVNIFNIIPQQMIGTGMWLTENSSWLWLAPISQQQGAYSALVVFITLLGMGAILFLLQRFKKAKPTMVKAWDCGFGGLTARMQYSSTAFAMPIRRVFQIFYQIFEKKERKFLDEKSLDTKSIVYDLQIGDWFWKVFYQPWVKAIDFISKIIAKFQSGNLRLYLTYVFVTLILLLWIIS